jgi:hypothetical protein
MNHSKWLRVDLPPTVNEENALGRTNFGFEVGAEFVHGDTTLLSELLLDRGFKLKELFTWAHGDGYGGVSAKPAPDGGIGMYWLGKEKRLLRFDDKDEDLQHMIDTLWALRDRSESATASDPRSLLQALKEAGTFCVNSHFHCQLWTSPVDQFQELQSVFLGWPSPVMPTL